MTPPRFPLHEDFPDVVWVVVEQPPGETHRLDYRPADGTFRRSQSVSLIAARGFGGAYGWVGGLGHPPGTHCDAILVTRQPRDALPPGALVAAHTCGVFYRSDGDHKLVALDGALLPAVERPDLAALDAATALEVRRLYPRIGAGEGWWGADDAREFLRRWRSGKTAAAAAVRRAAPVWGPEASLA